MATKPTEIPPVEAQAAITPPSTNGASSGPMMKRREAWISLPGDYEAFQFRCWINHPTGLIQAVKYQIGDEQKAALTQIVLEHNGWRDFDGNPYPPATDPEFWDAIPDEVAAAIFAAIDVEKEKLPNSARTMRRR